MSEPVLSARGLVKTYRGGERLIEVLAARVREAGCVILGKTTMPDYGMLSSGLSSFHPLTRNPWDPGRVPGPILALVRRLQDAGHPSFIVGGAVRELLRGRDTKDWDVATGARRHVLEGHAGSVRAAAFSLQVSQRRAPCSEELEVALDLPGGDVALVLDPLHALQAQELLREVHAERFAQTVHRVGSKHPRTRTARWTYKFFKDR